MVELLEDDVHDADMQEKVPDAGLQTRSCMDVLYDVAVVGLDCRRTRLSLVMYTYKSKMYK